MTTVGDLDVLTSEAIARRNRKVDAIYSIYGIAFAITLACVAPVAAEPSSPAALFQSHCSSCHEAADTRAPAVAALRAWSPEAIVYALTSGAMRQQGQSLTPAEKQAIAEHLSGRKSGDSGTASRPVACRGRRDFAWGGPQWSGWGPDSSNRRFQSTAAAGLTASNIPALELKWAFGFPGEAVARSLPTVAAGRVFVGSQRGTVYSLDAKTGCVLWTFQASGSVRSGIVLGRSSSGRPTAYFGDSTATAYAVDAATGEFRWKRKLDEHLAAQIVGTPALDHDRLYVTMSSTEETNALDPKYDCCTFRGSVSALRIDDGSVVWKTYSLRAPEAVGKRPSGATFYGPSGGAIWGSPTVDPKRGVVYVATGNQYVGPNDPGSDAIAAFDLATGRRVWTAQITPNDFQLARCDAHTDPACHEVAGPDVDFGSAPMLVKCADGRELVVAAQKSGVGWAVDPDRNGAVVWSYRAGQGGMLGGMQWGSAADTQNAYFPVSDVLSPNPGGLHAVSLATGERVWSAQLPEPPCGPPSRGCNRALSAAITVIPGAVFAGSMDGTLRAFSTRDGGVLWEYDTNREFSTVNGVPANGASINGPGPIVAGGMLFVGSGYANFQGRPGNVLLAFGKGGSDHAQK